MASNTLAPYVPQWIASNLPSHGGWLPNWLFLTSIVATGNAIQTYLTTSYTARVYSSPGSVNSLSARTFGTWTFLASVIRFYAAYNIANSQIYDMALISYVVAFGHFWSEWLFFRSARWGKGLSGPIVVSTLSLLWMWTQRETYIS